VIEEHLLGQRGALAQTEQLKDAVFLAGKVHRRVVDRNDASIEIDGEFAGPDRGFRVALGHVPTFLGLPVR
jgi:hypothetical protein